VIAPVVRALRSVNRITAAEALGQVELSLQEILD
jgi:hypothetical protein